MINFVNYLADHAMVISVAAVVMIVAIVLIWLIIHVVQGDGKKRNGSSGEKIFNKVISENDFSAYMVLRMENLYPTYISENFEKIFGLNKDDLNTDIESAGSITDKDSERGFRTLLKSWDKSLPLSYEFPYTNGITGKSGYGKIKLEVKDDYYIIIVDEITDDKQIQLHMEEELQQAAVENKSKTDFLSSMSHEIRTPMNGIIGMLDLAKMDLDKGNNEALDDYLVRAKSLSQFLLTLINDILDMSRIESGKIELEQAEFDLFAVAEKLRSMFQNTVEEKGVRFAVDMEDLDVRYVIGDELRLNQIIINFISNAVKFTSKGEIVVTFRQMQKLDGQVRLMIRVRDTGKGIEPAFLSRIFKPFEQESAGIAKNYGGSGLGMSIADNMVRLMGGQIVIDSELEKGTDFTVYVSLPVADRDQTMPKEGDKIIDDQQGLNTDFDFNGLHILLAEDNDINAEIAMTILGLDGFVIDRAANGVQAAEMFKESEVNYYDVILMDIQMPEMNGWDTTIKIREMDKADAKSILIYALSANAFVEDKRHSIEVGMNGHISKPIDFNELKKLIAENLHK